MFQKEREVKILEKLRLYNRVSVKELYEEFNLSKSSIRRDLKILQMKGLLVRTYGGAIALRGREVYQPLEIRKREFRESKIRIAKKAASLIKKGEFIAINGGTTTYYMVPFLINMRDIAVITDSIEIYIELSKNKNIEHYLTGGSLSKDTMNLSGPLTVEALNHFFFDKLFLGVSGIHLEKGITGFIFEESITKKNMIKKAKQVIVCADSSKINRIDRCVISQVEGINILITDQGIKEEERKFLEKRGIEVILT